MSPQPPPEASTRHRRRRRRSPAPDRPRRHARWRDRRARAHHPELGGGGRVLRRALVARDAALVQLADLAADRRGLFAISRRARGRRHAIGSSSSISRTTPRRRFSEAGAPDDLKLIVGVGPVLERMLYHLGITTYRQIARWTERDIDDFDAKLPEFPGRIRRDGWVTQAKSLHQSKYGRSAAGSVSRCSCPPRADHDEGPCRTHSPPARCCRGVLTLVWGCNWPVLKMGVTSSRRSPFAAHAPLRRARPARRRRSSPAIRSESRAGSGAWSARAVQHRRLERPRAVRGRATSAGRSAILAYTMPIWSVLIRSYCCTSRCRVQGRRLVLGMAGWRCCWATTCGISNARRLPRC